MFRISTYNSDKITFRGGHIVGHRLVVSLIVRCSLVVSHIVRCSLVVSHIVRCSLVISLVVGLVGCFGLVVRLIVRLVVRLIMVNLVSQSATIQDIRDITPHRRGVVFHVCCPYCRVEA
jgi:hypothetical protein